MFIFALHLIISPVISLLAMGYGKGDICCESPSLLETAAELRRQIEPDITELEKVNDPVAIDYWLAKKSRLFARPAIDLVALSLSSPAVKETGGGIIGSPFEPLRSACGQVEMISQDICIVSFPGGPGVALIGFDEAEGKSFSTRLNSLEQTQTVSELLGLAEQTTAQAALVMLDGCRTAETGGGFYVRDMGVKKVYQLPESRGSSCWLELYMS